ncbi:hypothetical protein PC128_g25919 [Phytophthora cactorum]|nr:hypothetical protein PC120_g25264 [Phytophthora cactorum]KAG3136316.1 hypothetical protein PC128_g25919 [Phytophthora cactorum]
MEIEPPGETKARLAEELGAGPASTNTARVCFGYAASPLLEGANALQFLDRISATEGRIS